MVSSVDPILSRLFRVFIWLLAWVLALEAAPLAEENAGAGVPLEEREALRRVIQLEDERHFDTAFFSSVLTHPEKKVRHRACLAAGRIGDPKAVELLGPFLSDPSSLGSEAAFSLGLIGDARAVSLLLSALSHEDTKLSTAVMGALGRIGGDEAVDALIHQLGEKEAPIDVLGEACFSLGRLAALKGVAALTQALSHPHQDVRWKAAFALTRIPKNGKPKALLSLFEDDHTYCRLYAAKAMVGAKFEGVEEAYGELSHHEDWRIVNEAVRGLGAVGTSTAVDRLILLARHDSHHVRFQVLLTLGEVDLDRLGFPKETRILAKATILISLRDSSPQVVAEAVRQYGFMFRRFAWRRLPGFFKDEDPLIRAAAARVLPETQRNEVFTLLKSALEDPDPRVGEAALSGVADIKLVPARSLLLAALKTSDLALVTTAADAMGARKEKRALDPLLVALSLLKGSGFSEARIAILRALSVLGEEKARDAVLKGLTDPDPAVRLAARDLLETSLGATPEELPVRSELARVTPAPTTPLFELSDAWENEELPQVLLQTSRGSILIELFPGDAPVHVGGFLKRVEEGFYDGLMFHRVVPNWVIQGGDPRGDGWGSGGVLLRDQVTSRPYERGSVGIPTSGKDTAGCQIFITHVPAPRLTGAYTQIGRVVRGMDVVDRIEIGDRILEAERKN